MKKSGYRSSTPTGEARSARVTMMGKPKGPLSYATKGQLTLRPQAMSGKPSLSKTTGYYPSPNVGPGRKGK